VALSAYDRIIGLDLGDISVDGCITKAPCGGDKAGPSPVDRRKQGLKRSTATEADGVPLGELLEEFGFDGETWGIHADFYDHDFGGCRDSERCP
jgi:hypothetical protein